MKSIEEIKAGLDICGTSDNCTDMDCPYGDETAGCLQLLMSDALSAMRRLFPALPEGADEGAFKCLSCGSSLGLEFGAAKYYGNYCNNCGQAIDWHFDIGVEGEA